MDFQLPSEYQMIKDTVSRFVKEELIPLEPTILAREAKEGAVGFFNNNDSISIESCWTNSQLVDFIASLQSLISIEINLAFVLLSIAFKKTLVLRPLFTPSSTIIGLSLLKASKCISNNWFAENRDSVSILEFNVVENELQFNQVINLTSSSAVPTSKVWKIEAIGIGLNTDDSGLATNGFSTSDSPTIFTSPQTFTSSATWTVPPGVTNICIEAWGKGGDGGDCLNSSQLNYNVYAGAGGGGSYGYDCFIAHLAL